ncbi:hypothetical protein ACFX13_010392 [Malus domestica]|uniref:Pectinesterase inhibitor domain-containing protein n=1 Tax=Malus domestica TaxID=3750 RepID=A0A498IJI0_MALDO|nr:hypothetical protein DVH24_036473 [Malus domestica]
MVSYSSAISALFVVIASLIIPTSNGVSNKILTKICSRLTPDPDQCVTILQSDLRTASANLPELSLISLDLTGRQANHNLKTFRELSKNATHEPKLKNDFDACVRVYKDIKLKIKAAYLLSKKGQYRNVSDLSQAKELAFRCGRDINSLVVNELGSSMVLRLYTSISINRYIARTNA